MIASSHCCLSYRMYACHITNILQIGSLLSDDTSYIMNLSHQSRMMSPIAKFVILVPSTGCRLNWGSHLKTLRIFPVFLFLLFPRSLFPTCCWPFESYKESLYCWYCKGSWSSLSSWSSSSSSVQAYAFDLFWVGKSQGGMTVSAFFREALHKEPIVTFSCVIGAIGDSFISSIICSFIHPFTHSGIQSGRLSLPSCSCPIICSLHLCVCLFAAGCQSFELLCSATQFGINYIHACMRTFLNTHSLRHSPTAFSLYHAHVTEFAYYVTGILALPIAWVETLAHACHALMQEIRLVSRSGVDTRRRCDFDIEWHKKFLSHPTEHSYHITSHMPRSNHAMVPDYMIAKRIQAICRTRASFGWHSH